MNKVIVGILPFSRFEDDNDPYTDKYESLDLYTKRIHECNAIPRGLIPYNGLIPIEELDKCNAFLIQGGTKVEKYHYQVIDYCIKKNKPLLGICLGMQAIALFSDVYDYVDDFNKSEFFETYNRLKEENDNCLLRVLDKPNIHHNVINYENSDSARHEIEIKDKESVLYDIFQKDKLNVVSLHGSTVKFVGKKFRTTAYCDDIIEAIEYNDKNYFILGVQWHPEWDNDNLLFKRLIEEGAKRNG